MPSRRGRDKAVREVKNTLRRRIGKAVAAAYPGCSAVFVGQQSRAALVGRTFGFRVRDRMGNFRSNIVWLDSAYAGPVDPEWIRQAVAHSNG
jgi:hypothetical protein